MSRDKMLSKIVVNSIVWDMVVVGGGASGLGTAVDDAYWGQSITC